MKLIMIMMMTTMTTMIIRPNAERAIVTTPVYAEQMPKTILILPIVNHAIILTESDKSKDKDKDNDHFFFQLLLTMTYR